MSRDLLPTAQMMSAAVHALSSAYRSRQLRKIQENELSHELTLIKENQRTQREAQASAIKELKVYLSSQKIDAQHAIIKSYIDLQQHVFDRRFAFVAKHANHTIALVESHHSSLSRELDAINSSEFDITDDREFVKITMRKTEISNQLIDLEMLSHWLSTKYIDIIMNIDAPQISLAEITRPIKSIR